MTCHHLDCLFAVLPELVPESVICDGYLPSWSVYDSACMINGLFRFSGGQHMIYHAGYSTQSDCYELRLEGSKGALRCRGLHMSKNEMTYEFARAAAQPLKSSISTTGGRRPCPGRSSSTAGAPG